MQPRDYIEELHLLRQANRAHREGKQSLAAYLHSMAEAIERGSLPDKRLEAAEEALEGAIMLLAEFRKFYPDSHLEPASKLLEQMVAKWEGYRQGNLLS